MSRLLCAVLLLAVPTCLFAQVDVMAAPYDYEVTYTMTVSNQSSLVMYLDYVHDTMFGDIAWMFSPTLAPGDTEIATISYVLQFDDPDPLYNSVDFAYTDENGDPHINDAQAIVDILHPAFYYTIECPAELPPPGEPVTVQISFGNAGDVPMVVNVIEPPGFPEPVTLGIGETMTFMLFVDCVGDLACFEMLLVADFPPEYGISFPYEFAIEECCPCNGSPVEESTWGVIKALYR
jgi:hypothetical protein